MIGTALKKLASQYRLTVNSGAAYGYLFGSFVTLTEGLLSHRLSIYVGSVHVPLPQGETQTPAERCSALILDMIGKANGEANTYGLTRSRLNPAVAVTHHGSAVTLNFRPDSAGTKGLARFLAEQMPRITPLTAPLQCMHCGGHTHGQGYPVRIAADTVVPMHAECLQACVQAAPGAKALLPGILGAAAGALLGAFFWAGLHILGMPAVLGALLLLALTLGGYTLLRGVPGRAQAITVGACMAAAAVIGITAGYAWEFHSQYASYGTVVSGLMRESVFLRVMFKELFTSATLRTPMLLKLLCGLVFALLGAASGLFAPAGHSQAYKPHALPGQA